jgi:hypothetical protein
MRESPSMEKFSRLREDAKVVANWAARASP